MLLPQYVDQSTLRISHSAHTVVYYLKKTVDLVLIDIPPTLHDCILQCLQIRLATTIESKVWVSFVDFNLQPRPDVLNWVQIRRVGRPIVYLPSGSLLTVGNSTKHPDSCLLICIVDAANPGIEWFPSPEVMTSRASSERTTIEMRLARVRDAREQVVESSLGIQNCSTVTKYCLLQRSEKIWQGQQS